MSTADTKPNSSSSMTPVICVALVLCICLAGYIQYLCRRRYSRRHNVAEQVPQLFAQLRPNARPNAKAPRQLLPTIHDLNERMPVIEYAMWKTLHSGESAQQEKMKILSGAKFSIEPYPSPPVKAHTTLSPTEHHQWERETREPIEPSGQDALDVSGVSTMRQASQRGYIHMEPNEDICTICLEGLNSEDKVRGVGCGHVFHAICIDKWLTRRRACCPICKFQYFTISVYRGRHEYKSVRF